MSVATVSARSPQKSEIPAQLIHLFEARGLHGGDRIPTEQELANLLGVSRPVVREALSVLEGMGLCNARKGSGRTLAPFQFGDSVDKLMTLVKPSREWLAGLLAVRQVLENAMLPAAISRMTEETLAELEHLTAAMERKARDGLYFGEEDRQFHLALYRGLNNDVLNGILQTFWTLYDRQDVNALAHSQRLDETAAHHRKILSAIVSGDVRRVQHQLDAHFYDTAYALERSHAG